MPDLHPGLLAAVLAEPDDDTPRLILADWLEEHGQGERAEFIRVQCEWARQPKISTKYHRRLPRTLARREALYYREQELLNVAAAQDWSALPAAILSWQWRRGFVEHVTCTAEAWLDHGRAVLDAHPVRELTLTGCGRPFPYQPMMPLTQGLRRVTVDDAYFLEWLHLLGQYEPRRPEVALSTPLSAPRDGAYVRITREALFSDRTNQLYNLARQLGIPPRLINDPAASNYASHFATDIVFQRRTLDTGLGPTIADPRVFIDPSRPDITALSPSGTHPAPGATDSPGPGRT